MDKAPSFDLNEYMITLQGKKYLPVAPRLAWLREHHPDAIITTEIVEHNAAEKWCIIRATIQLPTGGSATGMARQEPTRIAQDYIANGETSSIGRALAALGYGTLTAIEFDQPGQVVDSPVSRPATLPHLTPANDAQRAWYRESMKRAGFASDDDRLAIAEQIGNAPFDRLPPTVLRDIVDAARATLVVKGEDGRWAIAEPVVELANTMA